MRPRFTYANVVSSVCLFLVLTGGAAYALDGSNTVFSDDIVNGDVKVADIGQGAVTADEIANNQVKAADIGDGEVRAADIGNGQVRTGDIGADEVRGPNVLGETLTGGDVAANSLKGVDVDEASLAGGLIPGIATSGLVKSSGVVRVDAPPEGTVTVRRLLSSGPFTIDGFCGTFGGETRAQVILGQPANSSMDSDADGGSNFTDAGGFPALAQQSAIPPAKAVDAGDYAVVAPGKALAGEALAGVNIMNSGCVWAVTGIG